MNKLLDMENLEWGPSECGTLWKPMIFGDIQQRLQTSIIYIFHCDPQYETHYILRFSTYTSVHIKQFLKILSMTVIFIKFILFYPIPSDFINVLNKPIKLIIWTLSNLFRLTFEKEQSRRRGWLYWDLKMKTNKTHQQLKF